MEPRRGSLSHPQRSNLSGPLGRTNLRDTVLVQSAGLHHSLKKLELGECKYVTGVGLRSFLEGHVSRNFLLVVRACPAIHLEDSKVLSSLVHLKYMPI